MEQSTAHVAPALAGLVVPIVRVRPHPKNANQGDVGSISESLLAFTQYVPIVAQQSTGYIVKGNHTYLAMHALGCQEIAVAFLDIDDLTAERILAGDNRHSERSTRDDDLLAALLLPLARADLLQGTGYDGEDVDRLLADLTRDAGPVFAPNLAPEHSTTLVTEAAVDRAAANLASRYGSTQDQIAVTCPHCTTIFYVNRDAQ